MTTEMKAAEWKCVVTCGTERFHNMRRFVRLDGQWKLLAWANERLLRSTP
jgi:hypothetical protein